MVWEVWRVWLSGKATLSEIENNWTICDLLDANDALDIEMEMTKEAQENQDT